MKVKVHVGAHETWIAALPESLKHEFSMEELEQMKQQFTDFDTSGDGSIAASELTVLMESMGIAATLEEKCFAKTKAQVQDLIDKVDENRSGELEYPEFVRLVSEFRRGNGDKLAIFLQYSKHILAIRRELLDLNTQPTANSQVFSVKENAWEWKVLVRGPSNSPYEEGIFNFFIRFSHEYPFEPPVLSCLTRIYHPNFVPLLNGSMSIYGLLHRWNPEWRMRRLLEEVEKLLVTPDEDLIALFEDETAEMLLGRGVDTPTATASILASSKAKAARHPRVITLECITTYRNDRETFTRNARKLTLQCENSIIKMLAQQQEVEADVRKEDQLRINEFGRNNASLHEIREQKKALKDKLDTLDDANTDLMMGEGDNVQLFIGESFVETSEDFAQEYLEKRVEETNDELKKLQTEESKLEARQAALKKVLYSRFGQSINLEDS
ncbi:Ubiquitin-conjugating enzyme E2 D4 [Phytophthora citrophthora]|uniref:Ubiquitin-conjugating enzyme E2 D4 n=1 Tax=Phytophthora citrophthora TaxID=4793 RepID=A0AAD9LPH7_9STRA|nr:Ubiquitin-conjugating enzyme E2 D4 [Phytophthora citrophthora]